MADQRVPVLAEHLRDDAPRAFRVAAAQVGGPWLDRKARLATVIAYSEAAAAEGAAMIAFPETYLSGYPFWIPRTDGARFDDARQKDCYAYYLDSAIEVPGPEVAELCTLAAELAITIVIGVTERGADSGRGSTYCTLLTVDPVRGVVGHHRKLVPTYDERLVWAYGDGAGLRVHAVGAARIGALNCWENWMPSARHALYAGGQDVHVGVWPGSTQLTTDITRFTALEGRVFVVAVSGVLRAEDVPDDFPLAAELRTNTPPIAFDGGSAIAGPDGQWLIPPVADEEGLLLADLDLAAVARARLTFDPTGHYARPDVFTNTVDRSRRSPVGFVDER